MQTLPLDFLQKRDISNFLKLRSARPGDDLAIGELLVKSFLETYAEKLPGVVANEERISELQNVASRREAGIVRVLEFGYRLIGTYALIHPENENNEAWTDSTATLRCLAMDREFHSLGLSELLMSDAIKIAKGWGARGICLHVQDGAHGVARLYEKIGFTRDPSGDKVSTGHLVKGYLLHIAERECH
jgi:GNAT superfamily N-acetyltransferase